MHPFWEESRVMVESLLVPSSRLLVCWFQTDCLLLLRPHMLQLAHSTFYCCHQVSVCHESQPVSLCCRVKPIGSYKLLEAFVSLPSMINELVQRYIDAFIFQKYIDAFAYSTAAVHRVYINLGCF